MAKALLVQSVPGVHVYVGGHFPPAINLLCAGGDAARSEGKGLQNKFDTRQEGVATYTCTPGALKCLIILLFMEITQWVGTNSCNNKCIYVYRCIYIRENKNNMPWGKKVRCTCVRREKADVHLEGAMYTWKNGCSTN